MTQNDAGAQLDRLETNVANLQTAVASEIEDLRAIKEQLGQQDPNLAARIGAVADHLENLTTNLTADDEPSQPTP